MPGRSSPVLLARSDRCGPEDEVTVFPDSIAGIANNIAISRLTRPTEPITGKIFDYFYYSLSLLASDSRFSA
ncbi:hypothetical protein E4U55_003301 [Claviceps digitariae]|nr:hypothetical protein E4U55_003301 [Claviceps digitariae]